MISQFLSPLRILRVALPLVVVACLTPNRASAECGDYVTILNGTAARHAFPGDTPDAAADPGRAPVRPPCEGPHCSGSPARQAPPLAPVVPIGSQAKELTQHLGTDGSEADRGAACDRDMSSSRPIRRASSIFHPPRA
jgi:hypothetical protein